MQGAAGPITSIKIVVEDEAAEGAGEAAAAGGGAMQGQATLEPSIRPRLWRIRGRLLKRRSLFLVSNLVPCLCCKVPTCVRGERLFSAACCALAHDGGLWLRDKKVNPVEKFKNPENPLK